MNSCSYVTNMANQAPVCDCDVIHQDVVDDVQSQLLPRAEYNHLAALFKLFSDPTRVKLLSALECHELCVCDLAVLLNVTKSAVSHQLKVLRMGKLVTYRRDGQIVYYSLADDHVRTLLDMAREHVHE